MPVEIGNIRNRSRVGVAWEMFMEMEYGTTGCGSGAFNVCDCNCKSVTDSWQFHVDTASRDRSSVPLFASASVSHISDVTEWVLEFSMYVYVSFAPQIQAKQRSVLLNFTGFSSLHVHLTPKLRRPLYGYCDLDWHGVVGKTIQGCMRPVMFGLGRARTG